MSENFLNQTGLEEAFRLINTKLPTDILLRIETLEEDVTALQKEVGSFVTQEELDELLQKTTSDLQDLKDKLEALKAAIGDTSELWGLTIVEFIHQSIADINQHISMQISGSHGPLSTAISNLRNELNALADIIANLPTSNDIDAPSPSQIWNNTAGAGFVIRTDIPATAAGHVICHIHGGAERLLRAVDTTIEFHHAATGLSTSSQMSMLNKGLEYNPFATFVDIDNTISIFLPHHEQRFAATVTVYWRSGTGFSARVGENRCVGVTRVTTAVTTGNHYVRCPLANVHNTGAGPSNRAITRFVATQDGDDNRRGNSRANSCATVAQALNLMGNTTTNAVLTINRHVAAAPALYAAATVYAVGDLCTGANGFVWRRRVAGSGTTPALTEAATAIWEFVRDASATLQPGCTWRGAYSTAATATYALGDIVTHATGLPAPNNLITYVCIVAIAGNNNLHTRPSGTLVPTRNWCPIGSHNPVVPATLTVAGFNRIDVNNTTPVLKTIILGNLTVTSNAAVVVATPIACSTFTASNCGSVNVTQVFHANSIAGHNTGTLSFNTTVTASLVSHTGCGLVQYIGTTTIVTDNNTRVALSARYSRVVIVGALIMHGNNRGASAAGNVAATNTAHATLIDRGAELIIAGGTSTSNVTVTVAGFGGAALNASFGGKIRINCRTLVTLRDAPNMLAQPAIGLMFRAETQGVIERGQNLQTLTRNGAIDQRVTNGRFVNERLATGFLGTETLIV